MEEEKGNQMVPLSKIRTEDTEKDTQSDRKLCTSANNTGRGKGNPHTHIKRMGQLLCPQSCIQIVRKFMELCTVQIDIYVLSPVQHTTQNEKQGHSETQSFHHEYQTIYISGKTP
jgi:hypothetical protein